MSAEQEHALSWLRKADEDLRAARKLMIPPDPILGIVVYHCQQAAEKAAKSILALHGERIPYEHDIGLILEKIEQYDSNLGQFRTKAETLTTYATDYRYPRPNPKPLSQETVETAIRDAESIVKHIHSLVPADTDDGGNGSGGDASDGQPQGSGIAGTGR